MIALPIRALAALLALTLGLAGLARAETSGPVVVELFTSQGCSSCPPADEILRGLAKRDDVIALALHVDYWDYIGWKDIFAKPAFTKRQKLYARAAGQRMVYTPQMVIGGESRVVGTRPMEVVESIGAHAARGYPVSVTLVRSPAGAELRAERSADAEGLGELVVLLVRFMPEQTVMITRGENAGRTLTYSNIVLSLEALGTWDGAAPLARHVPLVGQEDAAVLIQKVGHGPIVGAARLR